MNKFFALGLVLSAALFPGKTLAAQTASELERILSLPEVTYGDASWFILNAAGIPLVDNSQDGAYRFAADKQWLPKKAEARQPLSLGALSFLVMRAFNIKGGLMYTLFPGPRYAYRELSYRKILSGRAYSTMQVSGERLVRILSRALDYAGDGAAPPIPPEKPAALPSHRQEERERMVEHIHTELIEKNIRDTEVRSSAEGIAISLNNIQFLPDSTELMETEKEKLQSIARILNEFPDRPILIGGHTAMAGSAEGRRSISTSRAQAVADYLVLLGCRDQDEIRVHGYGAEQPLGDPDTEAGQALNRRVEIILLDEGIGDE
jgi:outer membrane protein OmpA-like peptidoglycan-associated protein